MKYRRLDEDGDYTFGAGSKNMIEGNEAIDQKIKTSVLLYYGEWWEDISIGIPLFQSVLGQANFDASLNALRYLLVQRIEEIPEVESVIEFTPEVEDRNNRGVVVNVKVKLVNGDELEEEIKL